MIFLQLFFEFFKTGLFALGGGMATVPFLFDISARTGWYTANELANMIAVAESTPGPIGVNMATYVGFETAGIPGCIIATLGLIMPSVIIILIIASLLSKFAEKPVVKTVFKYLRPAVMGLLMYALYQVACVVFVVDSKIQIASVIAFLVLFFCTQKWKKVHPIVWIALGAVFGVLVL